MIDRRSTLAFLATMLPIATFSSAKALDAKAGSTRKAVKKIVDDAAKALFLACPQAVGLSIGVCKDGNSFSYNYGTRQKGVILKPTDKTIYPIASITKTFTGTLLAQAAIEKKIALDDDVRKYLDGDYPNLEFQGHYIRLYDLLDHRSGLPFILPDRPELIPGYDNDAVPESARLAEALKTYSRSDFYSDLRMVTLKSPPGEQFSYSNTGAQLAGSSWKAFTACLTKP